MGTGRPSVTVIALSMAAYVSKPLQIAVQKKKEKTLCVATICPCEGTSGLGSF